MGVAQGIGQQIAQCPAEHQAITQDGTVAVQAQRDALFFRHGFIELQQSLCILGGRKRLLVRKVHPPFRLGQKEHVRDHAGEALVLLRIGFQGVAVGLGITPGGQGHLRLRQEIADGGTQLVCQVRREFRQPPEILLQAIQHLVECPGEVGHLDRNSLDGHALAELLACDDRGPGFHRPQGGQAFVGGKPAQHTTDADGQHRIQREGAPQLGHEMRVVYRVDGDQNIKSVG